MTEFFRDVPNLSYQQFSVFTKLFWEIKWESISQVKNFPAYFKSCKNFKGRLINVILFSPWYFLLLLRSMMKKELLFAWFKFKKPPFGTKGVFLQADSPAQFIFFTTSQTLVREFLQQIMKKNETMIPTAFWHAMRKGFIYLQQKLKQSKRCRRYMKSIHRKHMA